MPVIDGRFAAQGVTEGGRTLTYDAIECLLDHEAGYGPPPPMMTERWLADRAASERDIAAWLAAESEATLLHHPRLRTPMGGGLAAFRSATEAQAFADANRLSDAVTLSWAEARDLASERPWVPAW
jgi:copper chaperone NosL